ncbi:BAG molecular chaperone regulator 2 [Parelaphostrongylus tenuis]|uniref:BAG molecular chaperone regulator 2 n=1 Tax=Parelaphostrongylus tenuis TaxID=148309 RepID=A0AAD5MGN9_PARTN|nr:BAG molecular chaperone regulator 2 [Parelaphostrongylus tenuis]
MFSLIRSQYNWATRCHSILPFTLTPSLSQIGHLHATIAFGSILIPTEMAARIIPITIQRSAESSNNDTKSSSNTKPTQILAPKPAPAPVPEPVPLQVPVSVPIPLPAPSPSPSPPPESASNTITSIASNDEMSTNTRGLPASFIRKQSIDDFNEQVVHILDEVEKRVEQLREAALMLEQEKEQILDMLNSVSLNSEMLRLGQGDREDITAITNRLAARTKTVDVVVNTPRSAEQQRALTSVNSLIEGVVQKMHDDMQAGKETCRRYLNACNPDQPDGPIDQKFQAQLIECTADDQKKIRRKLAQIISQFDRAERTFSPQW